MNLFEIHADALEHFHSLPTEKTVLNAIHFGESAFAQEAFNFVRVANGLTFFEQTHNPGMFAESQRNAM